MWLWINLLERNNYDILQAQAMAYLILIKTRLKSGFLTSLIVIKSVFI